MTSKLASVASILLVFQGAVASQTLTADRAARPEGLRQLIPGHYVYIRPATRSDSGWKRDPAHLGEICRD